MTAAPASWGRSSCWSRRNAATRPRWSLPGRLSESISTATSWRLPRKASVAARISGSNRRPCKAGELPCKVALANASHSVVRVSPHQGHALKP